MTTSPCRFPGCRYEPTSVPLKGGLCQMCTEDGCAPLTCTCTILDAPELDRDFWHSVTISVIKINPGCPVHTGPPNPSVAPASTTTAPVPNPAVPSPAPGGTGCDLRLPRSQSATGKFHLLRTGNDLAGSIRNTPIPVPVPLTPPGDLRKPADRGSYPRRRPPLADTVTYSNSVPAPRSGSPRQLTTPLSCSPGTYCSPRHHERG